MRNTSLKPFNSRFSVIYFMQIKQKDVISLKKTCKAVFLILLCAALLAGCTATPAPTAPPSTEPVPSVSQEPSPPVTPEPAPEPVPSEAPSPEPEPSPDPEHSPSPAPVPTLEESFPLRLGFSSGAGGWGTEIIIQQDLSFTGFYSDSDMGSVGEGHPHGTRYVCTFSGQFAQLTQIDEFSYALTLTELISDYEEGKEWIEDLILHVSSVPYGMETGTEFILYLPNTPTTGLSQEFLSWWPGRYGGTASSTLDFFGLYNVEPGYGFFGSTYNS